MKILKGRVEVRLSSDKCTLKVGSVELEPTSTRYFSELLNVSYSREFECLKKPAYYVFRNVIVTSSQERVFKKYGLRHDITVVMPGRMGLEKTRTHGHYHPIVSGVGYGEVYQVYSGRAAFILQERVDRGVVGDVIVMIASVGDSIYIPPTYGHVTYNIASTPLVLGNVVYGGFNSDYREYVEFRGPSHYILYNGRIVKNENYEFRGELLLAPENYYFKVRGSILREYTVKPLSYYRVLVVKVCS